MKEIKSSNNFVQRSGQNSPVDGIDIGARATPTLVDFDRDGDLDLFVGNEAGLISYLENVGSAAQPDFEELTGDANPFNNVIIAEERSNSTLADLDGDGQIDTAVVGNLAGTLRYFSYDGGRFIEKTGNDNPFEGVTVATRSAPEFVDLDGDGRLDLVVGDGDGALSLFRNDGAGFTQQTSGDNPFDGIDVGFNSTPTFADIDGDGDVDAFVGEFYGGTVYLENTGAATDPQFVERVGADNPLEGIGILGNVPTLGDLDGDGDFDVIIGGDDGLLTYFANGPSVSLSVDRVTPSESGAVSAFIVTSSEPAPEGGLTIQYTVEAGDYAATAGVDYQPLSGQVTIAAGETTAKIEVIPLDDPAVDPIETVTITLSPPEGYLVAASEATAYLAIADNEGDGKLANALNDPNFKDQWYLWNTPYNKGTAGIDLNVLEVWKDYSGKGMKVGIIDYNVQFDHPDLAANYDSAPNPDAVFDRESYAHGTSVAGIVAAEAGNGLGGIGIAHDATFTSYLASYENDFGAAEKALKAQMAMDVANSSWGVGGFVSDFRALNYVDEGKIIQEVVEKGRNGLGTVYVFSAGNDRQNDETANYSNIVNSRHTIGVAALKPDGAYASFSNPGASLLVSAFGANVFTTDISGEEGYTSGDYTFGFAGTSAAAPMVTGVVALMLEANPNLGYRDVQEILAYSAQWNDSENESWILNGANDWNGGGLRHSQDYGFGLVDALAAVRLAETWQTQHTAANEQHVSLSSAPTLAILDDDPTGVSDTIRVQGSVLEVVMR